jgi:hypothetical protein
VNHDVPEDLDQLDMEEEKKEHKKEEVDRERQIDFQDIKIAI